jgi:hypothetical protein
MIHLNKDQILEDKIGALDLKVQKKFDSFKIEMGQKAIDLETKITSQTASVSKAYSDGMGVLVNSVDTILKAREVGNLVIERKTPTFMLEDYENAKDVIDAANKYRTGYEKRVAAGTATEEDKVVAASMNAAAGMAISKNIKRIAAKESDIAAGSEDARFVEYAKKEMDSIRDETAKKNDEGEVKAGC